MESPSCQCRNFKSALSKFLSYHEVWYPANFSPFLIFLFICFPLLLAANYCRLHFDCIEVASLDQIRLDTCRYYESSRRVAWAQVNLSTRTVLPEPWLSAPCFTEYCISERNTHAKVVALINGSYKFRYHS